MRSADRGGEGHTRGVMAAHRLLIVEDDGVLRSQLSRGLGEEGFEIVAVADGAAALRCAEEHEPDALIVDIGLPDADGRDLCQALRARGIDAPVLFLTARDAMPDRLSAFSAGGDDYVTKPFHFDEVVARLRALLKRSGADPSTTVGPFKLDPVTHAISSADREVALTPTEFRLLAALAARPGEVVRRRELVQAAWPAGAMVHDNTLDQYVARLRRKLRDVAAPAAIATAHGVGYRLQ
jgi:DNA-binding response OmpR family regulator